MSLFNKNTYMWLLASAALLGVLAITMVSKSHCGLSSCGANNVTARYAKFIGDEFAFLQNESNKIKSENTSSLMNAFFENTKMRKPISTNYLVSRIYFLKSLAEKEKARGLDPSAVDFEYLTLVDKVFRNFSSNDLYLNTFSQDDQDINQFELTELKNLDREILQKTEKKWKLSALAMIKKTKKSTSRGLSSGPSKKEWDNLDRNISAFQIEK